MKLAALALSTLIVLAFVPARPALADAAAAARYYEDGRARFAEGDRAGAIIQLKNALQQEREMLAAQLLLAQAYLAEGDIGPAEVAFTEAARLGVDRSEVAVPLARIFLAHGKPDEVLAKVPAEGLPAAIAHQVHALHGAAHAALGDLAASRLSFTHARALKPEAVEPLIDEVPILLAAGELGLAAERAERAAELAPGNAAAWNALASVHHARGALAVALAHYGRALERDQDFTEARIARAALLIDLERDDDAGSDLYYLEEAGASDPRATYLRALLATRAGDPRASAALMADVATQVDALPPAWLAGREQLLMLGALAHHAASQNAKAHGYLDVLVARFPHNVGARRLLAAVLLDESEFAEARGLLEAILRAQPGDVQARLLLGRVFYAQKRYAQAEAHLARAAETGTASAPAVDAALGLTRLATGNSVQALRNLEAALERSPGDPGLASTVASLHLRRGNPQAALQAAETLVAQGGPSALAYNLLGVVNGARGDAKNARAAYLNALQGDPAFRPARLNLVRLDAAQGRVSEARNVLEALIAEDRRDDVAMFELGVLELEAGRHAEAVVWLEKSLLENPASSRAALRLIEAHLARGAASHALDAARALVSREGRDPVALSALARTQLAVGDRPGAQQTLRRLSRLAEFDPEIQVRIGYLQLSAESLEDAAYSAHKALTGKPGDADALVLATEVALARAQGEQAHAFVTELSRLHPTHLARHRLAGEVAWAHEDFDAAERHFGAALAHAPERRLLLRRVQAAARAGRTADAVAMCREWLAERPDDAAVGGALGELHMASGDWGAAREVYRAVIAGGTASAGVYNNLANVLDRLGDDGALAAARKAHELEPANPYALDTLGWLLVRGGQRDEGMRYLRDARLRAPANPEIRYHLGHALVEAGLREEARRELASALEEADFEGRDDAARLFASIERAP